MARRPNAYSQLIQEGTPAAESGNTVKPQSGKTVKITIYPSQEQLDKLIRALDDDSYDKRQDATRALERLGERAGPALHKALGQPMSVEARSRAEAILARLGPGGAGVLGSVRAVEILERLRSREATAFIQDLAKGDQSSPIPQAAQAALHRLKPR